MSGDLVPLLGPETTVKVSSTLNKSVGKKYLIDGDPETCWTSQQGLPQFIQLVFGKKVDPRRLHLTFQGGFVGTCCSIQYRASDHLAGEDTASKSDWQSLCSVYPEDVNRRQSFDIVTTGLIEHGVDALKFVFEESSDFFGRITIYDMQLEGWLLQSDGG